MVVQHKSGCGTAAIVLGIFAGVIVLLIGGCFALGLGAAGGIARQASEEQTARDAQEKAELAKPVKVSTIPWSEVAAVYAVGSTATDLTREERWKDYKGKTIWWTGTLVDATKDFRGQYKLSVRHQPNTLTSDVIVTLRDDQGPPAAALRKGDNVTYQARLVSWGSLLPITADNGVVIR